MANIKNFGIRGIGSDVQFGKSGGRVVYDSGNSLFKVTTDGTTLGKLSVATPTSDNHVANKSYVDSVASGLDVKDSVRAASTGNVTLTAPGASIDGVTMAANDRVLLKNQSSGDENGIYVWTALDATMARASDMDGTDEFVGAFFFVEEGTINSDQGFVCSTNGTIVVDTTSIAFTQFTGTGQLTAGAGLSKSGNTLTVNVDDTYVRVVGDALTLKGTGTAGQILRSDGSSGVAYGALDLTNSNAVAGALGLVNGGLGVDASSGGGKTTARSNLGLGSMAVQNSTGVAITGGSIDISTGTLTLANDQISGDKVSGGTIDGANLSGGVAKTISAYDVTIGAGKTLDVDGVVDIDASSGNMDNVAIGGTTSAAGTFTTMTSGSVDINGGAIDGVTIGGAVAGAITGTNISASGTLKTNTLDNFSGTDIAVSAPMNITGNVGVTGSVTATTSMITDTIAERTGAAGVTADGVLLKDGVVTGDLTGDVTGDVTGDLTGNSAGVHTGAVTGNVTGNTAGTHTGSVDVSSDTLTLAADQISGDKVHGGTISNFASTGIDDNADQTVLTIGADESALFAGAVTVSGDLTVNGALTSISTTNTTIEDNIIVLNKGESGAVVTEGTSGIEIDRGTGDNATLLWNETGTQWEIKQGASLTDLKASAFIGALTGDVTGDVTGDLTGDVTGDVTGDLTGNSAGVHTGNVTGNLTGNSAGVHTGAVTGNVTGNVTGDLTGNSAGVHTGNVTGNLTGNSAGVHTGAVTGNVTGNTAGVHTGAVTGDVTGDLTGDVTGDLTGDSAGTHTGAVVGNVTGNITSTGSSAFSSIDVNGGAIDGTTIGANTSAAGTFSTMTTASAAITGGTASLTTATATNLNSGNATITGGAISGATVDMTGKTLTLDNDAISGDKIHAGTISGASLAGSADTMSGYDITVGAGRTLDVSSGTLTLAANQISGDKVHGGTISTFASTGIDDNATATKLTLSDTTATFGVAGDFGANDLDAGASTLASLSVTGNASVTGNLTVSGSVTTTLSETVNIEDNIIVLNSNHTGAATQDAGISIERGASDDAHIMWNETTNKFNLLEGSAAADLVIGDLTVSEIALTNELPLNMGGTHTDTSGYAANSIMLMSGSAGVSELAKGGNSTVLKVASNGSLGYAKVDLTADITGTLPIANGGTGITSAGSDNKVMTSDGTNLGMEYVGQLRNSTGVMAIDGSGVTSGSGEYIALTNATGKVTMTAKNAAGSGAVDLYLQGQSGGDVFIVGQSGEALIQGEDDADLTVGGGDASGAAAGDLILKGGNGTGGNASGSVIVKGGNGGASDGNVQIKGADDTAIATFVETASGTDSLTVTNGIGGVELALAGGTNINMNLAPKGSGLVLAPSGYDMSGGADHALASKGYVDDKTATAGAAGTRRVSFTANGSSSFTIGTMANIAGKAYYVSRVLAKVTTAFVGADELVVGDGTNTLMATTEADLSEVGLYIVDLGFENATTGGATITGTIQNGGASASPTVGAVIVTAEYKQI